MGNLIEPVIITIGTRQFNKFSDKIYKVKQVETGIIYNEAVDVIGGKYSYILTNILKENEDAINS